MQEVDVDVALVLFDDQAFAAAQQARRPFLGTGRGSGSMSTGSWRATSPDGPERTQLVLFVGAGASIGAGGPSWPDLLDRLAERAELNGDDRDELRARLDAATLGKCSHARWASKSCGKRSSN
jgi:hypothetical protein